MSTFQPSYLGSQFNNLDIVASPTGANGLGDLYVQRNANINGALGAGSASLSGNLNVVGSTTLSTNVAALSISGSNGISASVGGACSLVTTSGNVNVAAQSGAVQIDATANSRFNVNGAYTLALGSTAGQVAISSGQAQPNGILLSNATSGGGITLSSNTGGISTVTSGNRTETVNQASATYLVNSAASGQNLTLQLAGATSSGISLLSSGIGANAINLATSAATSGITVSAAGTAGMVTSLPAGPWNTTAGLGFNLLGAGAASKIATTDSSNLTMQSTSGNLSLIGGSGVNNAVSIAASNAAGGIVMTANTGGYSLTSNGGPVTMSSSGAMMTFNNATTAAGQDTYLNVTGGTASRMHLLCDGTGADATRIESTGTTGGVVLKSVNAGVVIAAGQGINLTSAAVPSTWTHTQTGANQDLTLATTGAFTSRNIIHAEGTTLDALRLESINGGITALGTSVNIDASTASGAGINIGTVTAGVPINIGTSNSTTTINGSLTVKGSMETINSTTVSIADNAILLNASPTMAADSGLVIKRYQAANNTGAGEVVADTPDLTGTAQSGSTATTIVLASTASATDSFYNGYWIMITSGTGNNQVRRIKSYVGSTKTASIFSTADQAGFNPPRTPTMGLDFATIPDNTSVYGLYSAFFIFNFFQDSTGQYAVGSGPQDPTYESAIAITKYIPFHAQFVDVETMIKTNIIQPHTAGQPVVVSGVSFLNGAITGVTSINGNKLDQTLSLTVSNTDITTGQTITAASTYGAYMIIVNNTSATNGSNGIFMLSGWGSNRNVSVISTSRGTNGEQIIVTWPANASPQLVHRIPASSNTGTNVTYSVKVTTS